MEEVEQAMEYITRNDVFEFGALYFLQLIGSAMGTSAAVMFTTIYFSYHEEVHLIKEWQELALQSMFH